MIPNHTARGVWVSLIITVMLVLPLAPVWDAGASAATPETGYRMDETELQSRVMSFADRLSSILMTAFARYDKSNPSTKDRNEVLSIVVYTLWNAYIIASESDPDIALLDMISMVTLGRVVFEEQGVKTFGQTVQPLIVGFRKAEEDIRGIAILTLDQKQLAHLMTLIQRWRKNHPKVTYFPFIRFSDFSADRRESKLTRAEAPDGLIDSVEAATRQAQEMRLLAERGLYLGTRMPQLTGLFADLWTAKLADEISTERKNAVMQFVDVFKAERQAAITDFMTKVATERRNTVKQLRDLLKSERQAAVEDFMAEVTTERRNAVAQMGDILEAERQATVDDFMVREKLIIQDALAQMTRTAEALVDQTLIRITILVALFLVGLTLANLLVGYIVHRKFSRRQDE